jgi:hypothetical protein
MRTLRFACALVMLTSAAFSQNLDKLSGTVVFLYKIQQRPVIKDGKPVVEPHIDYGTGFFATPDGTTMIVVTAEHVSSIIKSDFRATLLGDNDTPFDVSSEELTGTKDVVWVSHGKEDVAVALIHPKQDVMAKLAGRFLRRTMLSSDNTAPSRERPLTTLGFPLALGVKEHFSPITRDSQPASGLITIPRFDTHTPATFFLLDNPSIAGFSGAPVFLFPKPFASTSGAMVFTETGPGATNSILCVGIVHGTISDETGGKMSAVTPSKYILETIDKALAPKSVH